MMPRQPIWKLDVDVGNWSHLQFPTSNLQPLRTVPIPAVCNLEDESEATQHPRPFSFMPEGVFVCKR
jgi:hypothetical protein